MFRELDAMMSVPAVLVRNTRSAAGNNRSRSFESHPRGEPDAFPGIFLFPAGKILLRLQENAGVFSISEKVSCNTFGIAVVQPRRLFVQSTKSPARSGSTAQGREFAGTASSRASGVPPDRHIRKRKKLRLTMNFSLEVFEYLSCDSLKFAQTGVY